MADTLYWNTVDPYLGSCLRKLMQAKIFMPFRLVGGTALSLQLGHRMSVDIDLFTDSEYGRIDFNAIDAWLKENFAYVDSQQPGSGIGMGRPYFIGSTQNKSIKLDLYYTEPFIRPELITDGIRMAATEDILAMKIDIISRGGRMKDFWDLHELMDAYSIEKMIGLHAEKYPYQHHALEIKAKLTDFTQADEDFEPICQRGKHWELIKLDFIEAMEKKTF